MNTTLDQQLVRVASALCKAVGTEVSDNVVKHLKDGNLLGLVSMTIDPRTYTSFQRFKEDYACVEFLRKLPLEIPGIDRKKIARDGFFSCEHVCHKTNLRLDPHLYGHYDPKDVHLIEFFDKARAWIASTLGKAPSDLHGKFGPGSTYGDRGHYTTIPDKMSSRPTVTPNSRDLLPLLHESAWFREMVLESKESDPLTIRGNRFTSVAKDALKERGICIEPSINIFLQLAVGGIIRRRLKYRGIDLNHGQLHHVNCARQASLDGKHATIDLSNASDTVAKTLVKLLLPDAWFQLLDTLRSPFTWIDGKWVKLEKFSSMGNGFTFELETLIFAAICFAAGAGFPLIDFSVYGDDMIVPSDKAHGVIAALRYCGFSTNSRKTFVDGPFRESCGGDFFLGKAVRPHYVKELPTEPHHWISIANGIRRMVVDNNHPDLSYSFALTAWQRALDAIPVDIRRLRGPSELGDLVIHDNQFKRRWKNGTGYVKVWKPIQKRVSLIHFRPGVVMASALYGVGSRGVIPRNSTTGYKTGYVAFS